MLGWMYLCVKEALFTQKNYTLEVVSRSFNMAINMGIILEIKWNGKNYNEWVHKIEPFLTMRMQYDLVSGKETLPTEQRALENGSKI